MSPQLKQTLPVQTCSSKHSTESICPNQSSSSVSSDPFELAVVLLVVIGILSGIYLQGKKSGAQDLTAQLPDCKTFFKREALQKEENNLKSPNNMWVRLDPVYRQKKEKELAEKVETLDKEELEHLRQRAMVLERKLKTQNASIETEDAREHPRGAVNAEISPDKAYARKLEGLYLETADPHPRDPLLGRKEKGPLGCPEYPYCSGVNADPPKRQAEVFPSTKVVPQDPNQVIGMNEMPRTVPHEDDSMTHARPDTKPIGPSMTKAGRGPASNVVLESLSADNNAAKDEMGQIRLAKKALEGRKKELEAQAKDRKKLIQELNASKSGGISSIASGMLLGSALAFGVTMIRSAIGS